MESLNNKITLKSGWILSNWDLLNSDQLKMYLNQLINLLNDNQDNFGPILDELVICLWDNLEQIKYTIQCINYRYLHRD